MNIPEIEFRWCREQDLPEVINLLKQSDLPATDVSLRKIRIILAMLDNEIAGCIGLEEYGSHGLLRSLVVKPDARNRGIGGALYLNLMSYCAQKGIKHIHLLTIDAEGFFQSKGFEIADRSSAPDSIKQTTEFTELCPSTCAYLVNDDL